MTRFHAPIIALFFYLWNGKIDNYRVKIVTVKDYQIYLPKRPDTGAWGCVVTSVGYARVLSGGAYPPHRHPTDHHFTWAHGRILNAWQLVFVSEGRGVFESAPAFHKENFEAGTVLMLFPGVWHRYAPDPKTGWVEHWIEFRGKALDAIIKTGILQPQESLLSVGTNTDLLRCFERCHELAARGALAHQDMLSTMALHILSVLDRIRRGGAEPQRGIDAAVERGQTLISLGCGEPLNLPKLARELGVSYSNFRQAFKARTGLSPKQHHM
ncbi:MAG: AraC family ligand binding domain-containing protein, partial [Limisphaerales bacterium]